MFDRIRQIHRPQTPLKNTGHWSSDGMVSFAPPYSPSTPSRVCWRHMPEFRREAVERIKRANNLSARSSWRMWSSPRLAGTGDLADGMLKARCEKPIFVMCPWSYFTCASRSLRKGQRNYHTGRTEPCRSSKRLTLLPSRLPTHEHPSVSTISMIRAAPTRTAHDCGWFLLCPFTVLGLKPPPSGCAGMLTGREDPQSGVLGETQSGTPSDTPRWWGGKGRIAWISIHGCIMLRVFLFHIIMIIYKFHKGRLPLVPVSHSSCVSSSRRACKKELDFADKDFSQFLMVHDMRDA